MRQPFIRMVFATLVLAPGVATGQVRWVGPASGCSLREGHSLVSSAVRSLKGAAEARSPDEREKNLRDAQRSLTEALTTGNQSKNAAAWYYLGRYYADRGDAAGADSAFRQAETLMPQCKDDISFRRRNDVWLPALRAGAAALNAENYDSAIAAFRAANLIYDAEPQGFTSTAATFFNMPAGTFLPESVFRATHPTIPDSLMQRAYDSAVNARYDSAAKYFRRAVQASTDSQFANEHKDAMFNLGNAFYVAEQYDSAAGAYTEYLHAVPNDALALTRLADVLAAGGHADSAMRVQREILAHPDSVDPITLFNVGVSIYNSAPPMPDTAGIGSSCRTEQRGGRAALTPAQRRAIAVTCDSVTAKAVKDRRVVAAEYYRLAAMAFESGLERNPQNREALFNLGNAFLALRMPDSMLATAQRLIQVDPMNRSSLRLLAQAWQLNGHGDSALYYVTQSDSLLRLEVTVGRFSLGDSSALLTGKVTNLHGTPSQAMKLVFEFLNGTGTVVTTQPLDVPALEADGTHQFRLEAVGRGIVAWRYKKA